MGRATEAININTQTRLLTEGHSVVEHLVLTDRSSSSWRVIVIHPDSSIPILPYPITMARMGDIDTAHQPIRTGSIAAPNPKWNARPVLVARDGGDSLIQLDRSDEFLRFSAALGVNASTRHVPVQIVDFNTPVLPGSGEPHTDGPFIYSDGLREIYAVPVIRINDISYFASAVLPIVIFEDRLIRQPMPRNLTQMSPLIQQS